MSVVCYVLLRDFCKRWILHFSRALQNNELAWLIRIFEAGVGSYRTKIKMILKLSRQVQCTRYQAIVRLNVPEPLVQ
jgi:hypothetical protein